jgi:hypothetical protein
MSVLVCFVTKQPSGRALGDFTLQPRMESGLVRNILAAEGADYGERPISNT